MAQQHPHKTSLGYILNAICGNFTAEPQMNKAHTCNTENSFESAVSFHFPQNQHEPGTKQSRTI